MEKIKWSDLPASVQVQKTVSRSALPTNLDMKTVPNDVTINPLTGQAREQAIREFDELTKTVSARIDASGGLTEAEISEIANYDPDDA